MTRMASLENFPGGSQSSALASTTSGKSESRQSFCVNGFHFSGNFRRGQAGADQNGAGRIGKFQFRLPDIDHHGLQLRRDGVINFFLREQRDESGLRALRGARSQNCRAVKTKTARDNRQMPERAFVSGDRRGVAENFGNRPAASSSIRF